MRKKLYTVLGSFGIGTMLVASAVQADRPGLQTVRTICPNGEAPAPTPSGYSCGNMVAPSPNSTCRPAGRTEGTYCLWTCGYPVKETPARCYDFHGKSVPCPDDANQCASNDYVWIAPAGHCDSDPGPEGGIYQEAPSPRQAVTFVPPPAVGEIYTVIDYKRTGHAAHPWERGALNVPTSVAVGWGGWHPHAVLGPPAGARGLVLRLHHVATDSVPLLVATDGYITSGPTQGRPPSEWTDPTYQHVQWP